MTRFASRLLSTCLALSLVAGCYVGSNGATDQSGGAGTGTGTGTGNNGVDPASTGLPCDVLAILQNNCVSCHGSTPIGGAPMSLVTYADLSAPAKTDASKTVAQLSLERMKDTSRPMPPAPASAVASADIATFEAWVTSGAPTGTCTSGSASSGNYNTPTVCTSKKTWNGGNEGSSSMHPGGACINCHSSGEGPSYLIAGTVYPSAHEPNDCDGVSGGVTVVITDANKQVLNLTVNSAGNFYSSRRTSIAMPYQAKVVANGKERVMATPQTTGDCNSCHTESGANNAPGRIMAP